MALGHLFNRNHIITQDFAKRATKITFLTGFPLIVFRELYRVDLTNAVRWQFLVYTAVSTLILLLVLVLIVPRFIKDPSRTGAFILSSFRSNYMILGLPIALQIMTSEQAAPLMLSMLTTGQIYNISTVIILSMFSDEDRVRGKDILLGIIKNPIIWGVFIGVSAKLSGFVFPEFFMNTVDYLADMALPLALLSLGAQFTADDLRSDVGMVNLSVFLKLILIPAIAVAPMLFMGFSGNEIAAVLFIFASPASLSTYALAASMGGDAKFIAKTVAVSSLLSTVTLFLWIFIFMQVGII